MYGGTRVGQGWEEEESSLDDAPTRHQESYVISSSNNSLRTFCPPHFGVKKPWPRGQGTCNSRGGRCSHCLSTLACLTVGGMEHHPLEIGDLFHDQRMLESDVNPLWESYSTPSTLKAWTSTAARHMQEHFPHLLDH